MSTVKIISRILGIGYGILNKKEVKVEKLLMKELNRVSVIYKVVHEVQKKVKEYQDKGYAKRNEIRKDITVLDRILKAIDGIINGDHIIDAEPKEVKKEDENENTMD